MHHGDRQQALLNEMKHLLSILDNVIVFVSNSNAEVIDADPCVFCKSLTMCERYILYLPTWPSWLSVQQAELDAMCRNSSLGQAHGTDFECTPDLARSWLKTSDIWVIHAVLLTQTSINNMDASGILLHLVSDIQSIFKSPWSFWALRWAAVQERQGLDLTTDYCEW